MTETRDADSLRLLYVGPYNSPHVADLAIAMRERGHVVEAAGEVWGGGLPSSSLPEHGVPIREMARPKILWMRRVIRAFRPDVVHAHWMPFAALAALAGADPLVATAWGSDVYGVGLKHRLLIRLALRRARVAMTDSLDLASRLEELGPSSLRAMVVNWGVDLSTFRMPTESERNELKKRFGLGAGPVVLSPRGVKELYNPEVVLQAFARVRGAIPDAQLVLKHGGAGELRREWTEAAGVHAVGRLDSQEMADLFRTATVTVSVPRSDSSPRSVWEAMAAGSATVLSDLPWVHELIENEHDALVAPAEPRAVASAIERLLRDEGLRERIVTSARRLVEEHRDRDKELARIERCYRELG